MSDTVTEVTEPRSIAGASGFTELVGRELGASPWHLITQAGIDAFGASTFDEQWIHSDPARAASGPYGGTIVHGYHLLSLLPHLARRTYRIEGASMMINYGLNRVRFITPVVSGSEIRAVFQVVSVKDGDGGFDVTLGVQIEIRGGSRPACVAETIGRIVMEGAPA